MVISQVTSRLLPAHIDPHSVLWLTNALTPCDSFRVLARRISIRPFVFCMLWFLVRVCSLAATVFSFVLTRTHSLVFPSVMHGLLCFDCGSALVSVYQSLAVFLRCLCAHRFFFDVFPFVRLSLLYR